MTTPREDAIAALHDYCPACPNGDRTQCREPLHDEIDRLAALAAEADRGTPDDEFVAQAQHYRAEHEATHGEAEQCGGPCIVLGLDDDGHWLDLDSPEAAERLATALHEHSADVNAEHGYVDHCGGRCVTALIEAMRREMEEPR